MDSFWIGRRVVVLRGKYQGFTGVITRSKATWAQLILDHNSVRCIFELIFKLTIV